jgi:hypothetical protein
VGGALGASERKEEIMKQERRKEATTDRDQDQQLRDPETRDGYEANNSVRFDSHESYADSLRGKSDGEILARFEF